MALNAYLTLKGQQQGDIRGSVTQKGREGKIAVIAVDHNLLRPYDEATGQPKGKRQHKPLLITKELDKSTPLLYRALVQGELLTYFELQFWTPQTNSTGGAGTERQHFTIKLTNARISGIHFAMLNNRNPELMRYAEFEEVSFTYSKIEWTWTDGGITAQDDWSAAI